VQGIKKPKDYSKIDLQISVEDTGIEIPQDQLKTIFESHKLRDGKEGEKLGIKGSGLTMTRQLVELMNGQISVKRSTDAETIFTILLQDVAISYTKASPSS
jgi:signal transduction histidine kinase